MSKCSKALMLANIRPSTMWLKNVI